MPQSWQCRQGECLLIPSGPNSYQHLFTILVNPCILPNRGNKPQVLSVGISSIRTNIPYDNACIIRQGEHPLSNMTVMSATVMQGLMPSST